MPLEKYIYNETRYTMLTQSKPEAAKRLLVEAQADVNAPLEASTSSWAKMPVGVEAKKEETKEAMTMPDLTTDISRTRS